MNTNRTTEGAIDTRSNSFFELQHIKMKVTALCNLRCPKCDYWKHPSPNVLTTEIIESIIDQGLARGLKKIHISGGEPTIRSDLMPIVSYGASRAVAFGIVTNGTYLQPQENLDLAKAGIGDWTFSLDTIDQIEYHESVGRIFDLQTLLKSIEFLAKRKAEGNHRLNILTVVTSKNFDRVAEIARTAYNLGADTFKIIPYDFRQANLNSGSPTPNQLNLTEEQIHRFNNESVPALETLSKTTKFSIYPSYGLHIFGRTTREIELAAMGDVALGYYSSNRCFMPWIHLSIFPSGDAYICCKKAFTVLGNIAKQPLSEILDGEVMKQARTLLTQHSPLVDCRSCTSNAYENRLLEARL
ncbi:MAG: radical SAM protein [Candidatus Woesearchaeota archaeon]